MAQKAWILPVETASHRYLRPLRAAQPKTHPRSHDHQPMHNHRPVIRSHQAHRRVSRHPIRSLPLPFPALTPKNFPSLVRQTIEPLTMPHTIITLISSLTLESHVAQAAMVLAVLAPEQPHMITYVIYHDHLIERRLLPRALAAVTVVARAFLAQSHMTICGILHSIRASRNQDKRLLQSHTT